MKVLVITGSAHKNGTSAHLAEKFIDGATESRHEVYRFDAAFKNVRPCIGCDKCQNGGSCAFQDYMGELNPKLLEADVVVFVSPIYYYDINAQIKTVIDRFYANDAKLHGSKKAAIMLTMADASEESAEGALGSFKGMTKYLGWEPVGSVVATNSWTLEMLQKTDFPRQAYELGKSL